MGGGGSVSKYMLVDKPDVNYVFNRDVGETLPVVSQSEPLERCGYVSGDFMSRKWGWRWTKQWKHLTVCQYEALNINLGQIYFAVLPYEA